MNSEHEIEQFMAAHDEFSSFYDNEFKHEPSLLNDSAVKNAAFVCFMEGLRRGRGFPPSPTVQSE